MLEVTVAEVEQVGLAASLLEGLGSDRPSVDQGRGLVTIKADNNIKGLLEAARRLDDRGVQVDDIALRRPSLDDVFLSLTGHDPDHEIAPETKETP